MDKNSLVGPKYWKSLDDLSETPAFKEWLTKEFPDGASESHGVNRRHFVKIMAASFGLAGMGLSGCRRPESYVLPYSKQPESVIPGVASYFCTSRPTANENIALIVENQEVRPTKIEGNPSYAPSGGSTDIFSQASVLDLYDPDRLTKSKSGKASIGKTKALDELKALADELKASKGKGVAVLANKSVSPTRARLVAEIKKNFPDLIWAEYEPVKQDSVEDATQAVFGKRVRPYYKFEQAKRVVSFDSNFLHHEVGSLDYTKSFSKARKVAKSEDSANMNRLYSLEANLTLTGSMADHRLRVSNSEMLNHLRAFAAIIIEKSQGDAKLVKKLRSLSGPIANEKWLKECAVDLLENKGSSVIVIGSNLTEEAHILAVSLNAIIGANNKTVEYLELDKATAGSISDVYKAISKGDVKKLISLNSNPAYNAPSSIDWKSLVKKLGTLVTVGYHDDETSVDADIAIAASHYLESWGDGRTVDGTLVPVQPMIEPLFETFSEIEILQALLGNKLDAYAEVRKTFNKLAGTSAQLAFDKFLADGVLENSRYQQAAIPFSSTSLAGYVAKLKPAKPAIASFSEIEVQFTPSNHAWDGRFNNNGWLQECSDPITKLTWDNALLVSPKLAKELQDESGIQLIPGTSPLIDAGVLKHHQGKFDRGHEMAVLAKVTIGGQTIEAPIHIQPGLATYTIIAPLGFGRTKTGRIGTNAGFNAYPLKDSETTNFRLGCKIELTDREHRLANIQEHWSMEGRAIIREASAEDYQANSDFVDKMGLEAHSPNIYGQDKDMPLEEKVTTTPRGSSAYEHPDHTGEQQWGMTIDLNTCTGCNACVVACQSENNIPIVGKDEVLRGREMHWMRIDRYYSSTEEGTKDGLPEDVQVSFQGIACAQCETAPCEMVCPVNATVHDDEGLNTMAYNRCVGTRYCANNCPYKVRRFNFFDWNKREIGSFTEGPLGPDKTGDLPSLQKNPDVSIRMRGVMEKCTYCTQRIQEAKINHKAKHEHESNWNEAVPDGTIKTACQQVCPASSIIFGDITDTDSEVYHSKMEDRDYSLLGYLNVRPRTTFLAKIRNPNPKMPNTYAQPYSRQDYDRLNPHGEHHDDHSADSHSDHGSHKNHEHEHHDSHAH